MGFTVYRTGDINTNERLIAFYKKELWASHILNTARQQLHYGTKWYRRNVEYRFPSARRYRRIKAIVSDAYRRLRKKYSTLAQL
jgi:hypothetical protein